MNTYSPEITALAARAGRAETEVANLREEAAKRENAHRREVAALRAELATQRRRAELAEAERDDLAQRPARDPMDAGRRRARLAEARRAKAGAR